MHIPKTLNTREIGQRVRQLRKEKSITQDTLGIILGNRTTGKPLSRGQISNLETGKRNFNIHQIKILADYFGVSFETLGVQSDKIETVDLLERARMLFENDDVSIEEKQELYDNIMKLYLTAREHSKRYDS